MDNYHLSKWEQLGGDERKITTEELLSEIEIVKQALKVRKISRFIRETKTYVNCGYGGMGRPATLKK